MADDTIATKIQTPNSMNTMGNMLNVANQAQQYQYQKAVIPAQIRQANAQADTAETQSKYAKWKLSGDQSQKASEIAGGLVNDPAMIIGDSHGSVNALMDAESQMRAGGIPEDMIRVRMAPLYQMATHNPGALRQTIMNNLQSAMPASSQVQTSGQSGTQTGLAEQTLNDWKDISGQASSSMQDIGVLQNIKKYSKGAFLGVASDRANYLSSLANYAGITLGDDAKTNTDLLNKSNAILSLVGGNTNLRTMLAESANPNNKMSYDAIQKVSDQLIAQKKMPLIKQQLLRPLINNPSAFQGAKSKLDTISDPRVLQFNDMSPQERAEMKATMSPSEQEKFGNMIGAYRRMGFIK